jgi:hypothetical protein
MHSHQKTSAILHGRAPKWRMPPQVLGLVLSAGVLGKYTQVRPPLSCEGAAFQFDIDIALDACKLNTFDTSKHTQYLQTAHCYDSNSSTLRHAHVALG